MTNGKITILTALQQAVNTLSLNKSIKTPRLDSEILLCHILNCDRLFIAVNKDKELSDVTYTNFIKLVKRREKNEPVSYITNTREFMSLNFHVEDGILIPRPETEILVESIIDIYKENSVKILDLCTGSGAIAVSLAYYLKESQIIAVDKYDICIETAKNNAITNSVKERINFLKADVLDNFDLNENFDCIVSNPPYIKSDVLSTLSPDVRCYEPMYALDGGKDGLIFYKKIIDFSKKRLLSGGILAFEIGFDQGEAVEKIIKDTNQFKSIKIIKDLAGCDRVIISEMR